MALATSLAVLLGWFASYTSWFSPDVSQTNGAYPNVALAWSDSLAAPSVAELVALSGADRPSEANLVELDPADSDSADLSDGALLLAHPAPAWMVEAVQALRGEEETASETSPERES